jgi:hypothetical protein
MSTDTVDGLSGHVRGITVTTLACIAGIAAAMGSYVITGVGSGTEPAVAATDSQALYLLIAAIVVQFPILHVIGVKFEDMSTKDYLYVAFMTFSLWFISFGIMLTAVGL